MKQKKYFWITLLVVTFNFSPQSVLAETNIRFPIEDPKNQALSNFYRSLTQNLIKTDNTPFSNTTRILHYGDSHIAADILTGELRNKFQSNFGDGGSGFVLAGKPWSWYTRKNVTTNLSNGWQVNGLSSSQLLTDGNLGLAGISFSTQQANQSSTLTATGRSFDIYLMKQPGGGAIEILLDGEKYRRRISLESDTYESTYVTVLAKTNSTHTITINTLRPGLVRVFGIDVHQDNGVIYDALGINGARASRFGLWNWDILADNVAHSQPNLIVISYGSNEIGDADLDLNEYQKRFSELLQNFHKAAPQASLLVISPPDRAIQVNGRWQSFSQMSQLVQAQRQAALSNGAAFWNLFQAMGGIGSIHNWTKQPIPLAQADHVHLTKSGYQLVAQTFYNELAKTYFSYFSKQTFHHWPCMDIF